MFGFLLFYLKNKIHITLRKEGKKIKVIIDKANSVSDGHTFKCTKITEVIDRMCCSKRNALLNCLVLRYASSKSTIEQCVFAVLSALCQLVLRHASSKCNTA